MSHALLQKLAQHQLWLSCPKDGTQLRVKKQAVCFDFTAYDLSRAIVSHADLSGSKFRKCAGANFVFTRGSADFSLADITDTTFEQADITQMDFLGAVWHEQPIHRFSAFQTDWFFVFQTNVFTQIGCMQKTLEDWITIGSSRKSLSALHEEQPSLDLDKVWEWWQKYGNAVRDLPPVKSLDRCSEWVAEWQYGSGFHWKQVTTTPDLAVGPPFDATELGQITEIQAE